MGLLCALGVLAVVVASSAVEFAEEWRLWKSQHGKSYQSQREELEKHRIWLSNRQYVIEHNKNVDLHGYTLSLNHFGDMVNANSSPPRPKVHIMVAGFLICLSIYYMIPAQPRVVSHYEDR